MSGMSLIGLLDKGMVRYIKCEYNGNLSEAGVILQLGYTTVDKINALLDLGHIAELGYNVEAPRFFKDGTEAMLYHTSSMLHIKTTVTLAYVRDMRGNVADNKAKVCSLENFVAYEAMGYFYDVEKRCWFVTVMGSKPCRLKKVLTDKEYFYNCNAEIANYNAWNSVSTAYVMRKNELAGEYTYTILERYNQWLKKQVNGNILEFGYAVRDGKRGYALLKRQSAGKCRRKVVKYSPYIGDLVQYVVLCKEMLN